MMERLILNHWSVKVEFREICAQGQFQTAYCGSVPGMLHARSIMDQVLQDQCQSHM